MKNVVKGFFCLALSLYCHVTIHAQENLDNQELKVEKRTLMERFEPEMILTPEERLALKQERLTQMRRNKRIIDTLSISERRRKNLRKDLLQDPLSQRLTKTLAEIELEEDLDN